ncbi:MAG TPA: sigma-54-dependent Fis family transcriptional regulator [Gemmatimonadaceae bacterium]|nr:sigma-54-dependent Fis family transcriptional regulator [Gemmatimonadaceae bacterium]
MSRKYPWNITDNATTTVLFDGSKYMKLVLEVWREVCQHLELEGSIARIADMMAQRIPLERVLIFRVDPDRHRLESAAIAAPSRRVTDTTPVRIDVSPPRIRGIVRWCRAGTLLRAGDLDPEGILRTLGSHREADTLVGPLFTADGALGAVVVVGPSGVRFSSDDADFVSALLEPLSAGLANDARLRELARLREAAEADNRALLSRLERQDIAEAIVGAESGLRTVIERVNQVAPTDAPVLIFGETGSGKEVVARLIHSQSKRATGPVVRVNCGALPPGLVDSELFGHERGSFTGATDARKGWFERADGGTLFLDEVGELPLDAQVRLLRILQDGTFERVGGQKTLTVDVRIITATHRDLQHMVAHRLFREDLWYRIGVFPIRLPPLRERLEDLPALAAHFASRAGLRLGAPPLVPTPADLDLLLSYPWPGNVRELASVIERAAILGEGKSLQIAAALGFLPAGDTRSDQPAATPPPRGISVTLADASRRHIEAVLSSTRGRIEGASGAAAQLGINPHTLRSRMRKLGIQWARFRPS